MDLQRAYDPLTITPRMDLLSKFFFHNPDNSAIVNLNLDLLY